MADRPKRPSSTRPRRPGGKSYSDKPGDVGMEIAERVIAMSDAEASRIVKRNGHTRLTDPKRIIEILVAGGAIEAPPNGEAPKRTRKRRSKPEGSEPS